MAKTPKNTGKDSLLGNIKAKKEVSAKATKKVVKAKTIPPHLIVEALAGTGKTTTLVEGLKVVWGQKPSITPSPQQQEIWESLAKSKGVASVCFVAFNKSIATELQSRVPAGCSAMTLHSLGLKAVTAVLGPKKINGYRVDNIFAEITGYDGYSIRKNEKVTVLLGLCKRLVGLCKANLIGHEGNLLGETSLESAVGELADIYDIDLNGNRSRVIELVPQILERCKQDDGEIDFDDMVWLPVALELPTTKYDLLLVDESQDLNRCQQELAIKSGERLVLCGDSRQAIYAFAGADSTSLRRMGARLQATPQGVECKQLTVTRRCSQVVVQEAQQFVPTFSAHESNRQGKISQATIQDYQATVVDGDMVVCRVTAPLVSQCFQFIKSGRKATIQGRDIGQGLSKLVEKMKAESLPELITLLEKWKDGEVAKENAKKFPSSNRIIGIEDKYDCLVYLSAGLRNVEELLTTIEALFTDQEKPGIRLSTIHKAKGLEAENVYLLEPEGATVPHPAAKTESEREQEWNLRYVAITRAIDTLVYVS